MHVCMGDVLEDEDEGKKSTEGKKERKKERRKDLPI